jgi:hypothetical protein
LQKKEARMRDPNYLKNLNSKIMENREKIDQLEKDNTNLKKQ